MDRNRELLNKLCDLEIPGNIKISPSGEKVLYSTSLTWGHLKGKVPVTTLWLATLGEANSSKRITDGKFRDHSLTWHPFKDEFAFISDRAGNSVKSAIYTTSLADVGKAVPVTPVENEQAIEKFKFSPNGTMIAYISNDEKTEEERQREKNQEDVQVWDQDHRYSRLRVIDLDTGEIITLPLDQHVLDFCWITGKSESHEDLEIGFISCSSNLIEYQYQVGTEIRIVKTDLKQSRKVCFFPGRPNDLSWGSTRTGDRKTLYFRSGSRTNKNFYGDALYKVTDEESGEYEHVTFENNHDIAAVQSVDGHIIAKAQNRLEDGLIWVGNKVLYSCKQEIEAYDVGSGFSNEQARLVIATSDINHPVEVYSVDASDGKKVQLSQHGESLRGQRFGTCTVLSCQATDDSKVEIDGIYLEPTFEHDGHPGTAPNKPYPTVVLIHGGPSVRVTNAFNTLYYMWTPYLLSLGYGLLLPNYRGGSGRGEEFSGYSYDGVGVHDYADIIALTQYAIEKGYADPDRLVVGGYSHGGHLTNLCALRNGAHGQGWTFKAAISGASISDIDAMSLTSDIGSIYQAELYNGAVPWNMSPDDTSTRRGSALWAFKEVIERSKKEGVSIIPPMLILHGANDERCHVSHSWAMRRALEYYSLPFEMAIYPRQGHIFQEQYFWIDMALRVGRWVERYIGPGRVNP